MKKAEKYILAVLLLSAIALSGFFLYPFVVLQGIKLPAISRSTDFTYGSIPELANADYYASVHEQFIENKKSFIEADLSAMRLRVYADGALSKEIPILTKGREGSWWETPAGLYKVESKEKSHFSSIGHVYQPYSMAFQGNFFIHGWPYYPDGTPVASAYSGGCIRLATEDAKAVYDLVSVGTPVLVYEGNTASDGFAYTAKVPDVTATRYMLADLRSNAVLAQKGMDDAVPIASITKLVSALVATEYINIEKNITVTQSELASTSKPRLISGQKTSVYDLLFPLLEESSNEAAYAIADSIGRERFVALMNEKAKAINMAHSSFVDPAGQRAGNVSTAEDLFALAKYILNNRSFVFKLSAGSTAGSAYGETSFADLQNFNIVQGTPGTFVGGKIGKTTAAGETYVGVWNEHVQDQDRPIVVILLGSTDVYADAKKMLDYVKAQY